MSSGLTPASTDELPKGKLGWLRAALAEARGQGVAGIFSRGATGTLIVTGAGALVGVGVQMLLARWLGVREWGYFAFCWTLLHLLVLLGKLGFDTAEIRFVAAYRVQQSWPLLAGLLRFGDRVVLAASLAVGAATAAVTLALSGTLGVGGRLEPGLTRTLLVSCLVLPWFSLLGLRGSALQGLRRVVLARVPEVVLRPPLTAALAGGLLLAWGQVSAAWVMAATGVAIALCVAVGHGLLERHLPAAVKVAEPEVQGREWMRVSLPLLLVSGMRLLLGQADILLVGMLIGTTEAGIYTAASRLSHLITFGQNAANGIVAPMIAELHAQDEKAKLQRLVTLASWGSTLFALAAALALVLGGKLLLSLFGKEFVGSWTVLAILAAGQVVNAASGPVGYLLNMTGHQDSNARILGWTVGLNVALAVPAILAWGAAGASAATGLMIATKNLWTWWEVRRRLGINSSIVPLPGVAR